MKRVVILTAVFGAMATSAVAQGHFVGRVVVEWLASERAADRNMKLIEEFSYVDPNDRTWTVPARAVINGASIPRVFWELIGPPFVGNYRRASVVHDYFVFLKQDTPKDVHRMFYDACITGGVPKTKAMVMYLAVKAGSNWEVIEMETALGTAAVPLPLPAIDISASELETLADWIEIEDPTLDELDIEFQRFIDARVG